MLSPLSRRRSLPPQEGAIERPLVVIAQHVGDLTNVEGCLLKVFAGQRTSRVRKQRLKAVALLA